MTSGAALPHHAAGAFAAGVVGVDEGHGEGVIGQGRQPLGRGATEESVVLGHGHVGEGVAPPQVASIA